MPTMDTGTKATPNTELNFSNPAGTDKGRQVDTSTSVKTMSSSSYYYASGSGVGSHQPVFQKSGSIKSDESLDLQGPLEIAGSVKSGGRINFDGDFMVKDKIDAFGAINMNGTVSSE